MQETDFNPTHPSSEPADGLEAAALRAQAWYGEPFLHSGEDPAAALAPGTARRRALDDAVAEMEAGNRTPSPIWRVDYGLMLGLERVLAAPKPQTAAGTDLRRHQVDALAGMLTELIAAHQRSAEENGNGSANGHTPEPDPADACLGCSMIYTWNADASIKSYKTLPAPGGSSLRFMCDVGDKRP